jgi:hypothetical protein
MRKHKEWWLKPNEEGVSNKDVFQVMLAGCILFGFLVVMYFIANSEFI